MDELEINKNLANELTESKINSDIEWTVEHEKILIEWADKAMCYRWMHSRTNVMYSNLNAWYTIPVIIMSTLTGTANFAQERVPVAYRGFFSMIVGGINIFAGIITTIQQFLKITQLNEAHRVSSIAWDKFYRNIKIELSKHPDERLNVIQMIKISKEEFDRLMETSPNIPDNIIQDFKTYFSNSDNYSEIFKPEICDVLISTNISRNPWYNDENKNKKIQETMKMISMKEIKNKQLHEYNLNCVKTFKKNFYDLNNREPLESEIIDNLKDTMSLDILKKIMNELSAEEDNIQIVEEIALDIL